MKHETTKTQEEKIAELKRQLTSDASSAYEVSLPEGPADLDDCLSDMSWDLTHELTDRYDEPIVDDQGNPTESVQVRQATIYTMLEIMLGGQFADTQRAIFDSEVQQLDSFEMFTKSYLKGLERYRASQARARLTAQVKENAKQFFIAYMLRDPSERPSIPKALGAYLRHCTPDHTMGNLGINSPLQTLREAYDSALIKVQDELDYEL